MKTMRTRTMKKYNVSMSQLGHTRRRKKREKEDKLIILKHTLGVGNMSRNRAEELLAQYNQLIESVFKDTHGFDIKNVILPMSSDNNKTDIELIYPIGKKNPKSNIKIDSIFDFKHWSRKLKIMNFVEDIDEEKIDF